MYPKKECAAELSALLGEGRILGATLLVLANKQDLSGALFGGRGVQAPWPDGRERGQDETLAGGCVLSGDR